ncbi:putative transcription initiation factor tfiid subunit 11 [Golovinomyces cichoracearum]|uniref:Putative transcription initiation factor tfiid subunit 11 n=1 Tax=Golovinomyces cichoracearum TaxID=62708 RepID=A0A420J0A1_9PEZI|nr:putative transcription initiation factor tfiid subunit 11 [Golovinomyces cichoracearum]
MASPPYHPSSSIGSSSNNAPYPAISQMAKRRQSDNPASTPASKRRKASLAQMNFNSATHPLRQTSFPPERASHSPAADSRSPSVDRMSIVSGSFAAGGKKKKQRKGKSRDTENSPVLGPRASSVSIEMSKGMLGKSNSDHIMEEEEDEVDQELAINTTENPREERVKEERRRHLLTRAFNPEQWQRYEAWRSSKLSDSVVRRIVNQTLSQSAPQQVILAVRSVAKIFAGDMIERARKVQTEWLEISGENPGLPSNADIVDQTTSEKKEKRRGPLMPDHLREAFRRHMLTDTALVGQLGLWQHQQQSGVERFGVKVGCKQLFK